MLTLVLLVLLFEVLLAAVAAVRQTVHAPSQRQPLWWCVIWHVPPFWAGWRAWWAGCCAGPVRRRSGRATPTSARRPPQRTRHRTRFHVVLGRSAARSPRFDILADVVARRPAFAGAFAVGLPSRRSWRTLDGFAVGAAFSPSRPGGRVRGLPAVWCRCWGWSGTIRDGPGHDYGAACVAVGARRGGLAVWAGGSGGGAGPVRVTMARHGYANHGQYIKGPHWGARRVRFLRTHGGYPPCWCCAIRRGRVFMVHHLDYSRAGAGLERDRDLRSVCERCHTRFHRGTGRVACCGLAG